MGGDLKKYIFIALFVFKSIIMLILIFNEFLLLFLVSENAPESEGGAQEKKPFFSAALVKVFMFEITADNLNTSAAKMNG